MLLATVAEALYERGSKSPIIGQPQPAVSQPPASCDDEDKLVSSLPTDDASFREIVEQFIERLKEQLAAMKRPGSRKLP